jgi:putative transposase
MSYKFLVSKEVYYLLKTGCQWDALPLCFGPAKTVYHRFRELLNANAFQKIWKLALTKYDEIHGLMLEHQSFDSCHKKAPLGGEKTGRSPVDRRKIGTKINLATDGNGLPIGLTIERGNNHDTQLFEGLIKDLSNQIGQSKNHFLHTDKGYVSARNRLLAISHNYTPVMPQKKKRNCPRSDHEKDKNRWVVERTFSWITRFRRLSIRYEKLKATFLSLAQFAFQIIILKKI